MKYSALYFVPKYRAPSGGRCAGLCLPAALAGAVLPTGPARVGLRRLVPPAASSEGDFLEPRKRSIIRLRRSQRCRAVCGSSRSGSAW